MSNNNEQPKRTEAQREASRRNGARSRGPVTPAGKAKSSRNALRHGLTAAKLVLGNEDSAAFQVFLNSMTKEIRPQGELETALVLEMAYMKWTQHRAWIVETAAINCEMSRTKEDIKADFDGYDEPSRTAYALQSLLTRNPAALATLHRTDARSSRQFHRALNALRSLRKENLQNEPDPPQPNQQVGEIPDEKRT